MKTLKLTTALLMLSLSMVGQTDATTQEAPYSIVESMPSFPGGEDAMKQYIQANVKYPSKERKHNITGTCYVTFVVEKDGSITGVMVLRGVTDGPGCDAESLRVIKAMPNWHPGMQNGRVVRTQFNLPIKFTLKNRR